MGAPDDGNYYRMETHYDNPQALSGIIDNSGITYLTISEIAKHFFSYVRKQF